MIPVSSHLKNLNHILVSVRDSLGVRNLYISGIIFTVSIMDPHDIALHTQTTATNIINTHTPGFTYLHVVYGYDYLYISSFRSAYWGLHTTAMRRLPYTLDMRGKIPFGLKLIPGELKVG